MKIIIKNHITDAVNIQPINNIEDLQKLIELFHVDCVTDGSIQEVAQNFCDYISGHHLDAHVEDDLAKGLNGDWKNEEFSIQHLHYPVNGEMRTDVRMYHTSQLDKNGNPKEGKGNVGYATFLHKDGNVLYPLFTGVDENHQRKGVATALYQHAENITKKKIIPSKTQSDDAVSFWNQASRHFGKSLTKTYSLKNPTSKANTQALDANTPNLDLHGPHIQSVEKNGLYVHTYERKPDENRKITTHIMSSSQDPKKTGIASINLITYKGSPATVQTSFVAKEHRGKGLGLALYQHALSHHKNLESDIVVSRAANSIWRKLGAKMGAEGTKERNTLSKSFPVGTIHTWANGEKVQKQENGEWTPVSENKTSTKDGISVEKTEKPVASKREKISKSLKEAENLEKQVQLDAHADQVKSILDKINSQYSGEITDNGTKFVIKNKILMHAVAQTSHINPSIDTDKILKRFIAGAIYNNFPLMFDKQELVKLGIAANYKNYTPKALEEKLLRKPDYPVHPSWRKNQSIEIKTETNLVASLVVSSPKLKKIGDDAIYVCDNILASVGVKLKTPLNFVVGGKSLSKSHLAHYSNYSKSIVLRDDFTGHTLMHELGHALDYAMALDGSQKLSEGNHAPDSEMSQILSIMKETEFYKTDYHSEHKKYINEPTEVFARAFEVYGIMKLAKNNAKPTSFSYGATAVELGVKVKSTEQIDAEHDPKIEKADNDYKELTKQEGISYEDRQVAVKKYIAAMADKASDVKKLQEKQAFLVLNEVGEKIFPLMEKLLQKQPIVKSQLFEPLTKSEDKTGHTMIDSKS